MKTSAVIIGAGHAGLAMSWRLAEHSIDHVILERGEVANSWRTERWDSLKLLTPNWQSRLPGYGYQGDDPDGFRDMNETVEFISGYAKSFSAPVRTHTTVSSVKENGNGFVLETPDTNWKARAVIMASGACNVPRIPRVAGDLPSSVRQLTPISYRNPAQLESGGVLVVGASASGIQIADELQRFGFPVTLAVGEHVRVPRVYRGRDIKWWMDRAGVLNERYDEVDDLVRARSVPSLQLAGSAERRTMDLNALSDIGVRLAGRVAGVQGKKVLFSGSLRNVCKLADLKMNRLLDTIDEWALEQGVDSEVSSIHRYEATRVEESPPLSLHLDDENINTVIWATGYSPDFSWLDLPVIDKRGRLRHDGGVVDHPGLYVLGLQFLRRRKSSLIDGAADDTRDIADHLHHFLDNGANKAN